MVREGSLEISAEGLKHVLGGHPRTPAFLGVPQPEALICSPGTDAFLQFREGAGRGIAPEAAVTAAGAMLQRRKQEVALKVAGLEPARARCTGAPAAPAALRASLHRSSLSIFSYTHSSFCPGLLYFQP